MSQSEKSPSHEIADRVMHDMLKAHSEEKPVLGINVGYEVWALLKMLPLTDSRTTKTFLPEDMDKFMGIPVTLDRDMPENEYKIVRAK